MMRRLLRALALLILPLVLLCSAARPAQAAMDYAKQVLIGTFTAVAVLACVLMLGNLFKKIEELLVDQNAPPEVVLRFALNVLPLSLMYTIPWGFLSAVLLVFGRLSSDQEITAFRVAGVSLTRLSMPVFVNPCRTAIGF